MIKPMLKAIHICNSHKPTHNPKIAKEYVFANAEKEKKPVANNGYKNIGRTVVSASFGFLAKFVSVDRYAAAKCPTFHTRAVSRNNRQPCDYGFV